MDSSSSNFQDWFKARCGPDGESAWLYQGGLYDPLTGEQLAHVEGLEIVQALSHGKNQDDDAAATPTNRDKVMDLLSIQKALSNPKAQYKQSATLLSRKIFIYRQVQDSSKLLNKVKLRPYSPEKNIPVEQAVTAYATANTFVERVPGREWIVVGEWPNGQTVWNRALLRRREDETNNELQSSATAVKPSPSDSNSLEFTVHVRPRPPRSKQRVPDLTMEPQTVRQQYAANENATRAATRSPPRSSLFSMGPSTAEKMGTGARETYHFEWMATAETPTKRKGGWFGFGGRRNIDDTTEQTGDDCTVQYTRYGEGPVWYGPNRFCTLELRGKRWPTESRPLPQHIAAWCQRHGWTLPRTVSSSQSLEQKVLAFRKETFLDLDKIYGKDNALADSSSAKWKNQHLEMSYRWMQKWGRKLRQAATLEMTEARQ